MRWIGRSARDAEIMPAKPGLQNIARRSARSTYAPPDFVRAMNIWVAFRISSATRASGETNFGVNHGNNPIRSCVTRICPSHCEPEPIPIVGISSTPVICRAASGLTISSTTAKTPAFSHRLGITQKRFRFCLRSAFHFIAAFLANALRQHPDMTHDGNARRDDRFDLPNMACASFQLHRLRPGFHQRAR